MAEGKTSESLHAFGPIMFIISLLTGSATTGQWKASETAASATTLPSTSGPTILSLAIFSVTWAGSALMGAIGVMGLTYFLLAALKRWRAWGIIVAGYLIDCSLTLLLVWPFRESVLADPLGPWPYVLGTLATVLAGVAVGFMAPYAPLRHACGLVSVDFLLSGVIGFISPQAITWKLITRIVAGYCAAGGGALIGQYARSAVRRDEHALGKLLGAIVLACVTSAIGGILTVVILEYTRG